MSKNLTDELYAVDCKSCGAHLKVNPMQNEVTCPYCGSVFSSPELLGESDAVRTERIKARTAIEIENVRFKNTMEKEDREEEKARAREFRRGKFGKFLIVCAVITGLCAMTGLSGKVTLRGLIALVQLGLFATAWLMGAGALKERKKNMRILLAVIALVLIIPFSMANGEKKQANGTKAKTFMWEDIESNNLLPKPEKLYGKIHINSKESMNLTLSKVSEKEYKTYRDKCIAYGYDIDAEEGWTIYRAYNSEGYKLFLSYYESLEEVTIDLDAPEELKIFEWPQIGPGSKIPETKSKMGKVLTNNSKEFEVIVGETSITDYQKYVSMCEIADYSENYEKSEKEFYAENAQGDTLRVDYQGANRIKIVIELAEIAVEEPVTETEEETLATEDVQETTVPEEVTQPETKPTEEEKATEQLENGMRPEFKQAMDSYEEFMDEYCAFMKKYNDTTEADLTMIVDYGKYVGKYTKMLYDFEKWEDEEMNDAETAYYIQVQTRINGKLLQLIA